MWSAVRKSLSYFTRRERVFWLLLVISRSLAAILDLVAILLVGFVASSVAYAVSMPNQSINEVLGIVDDGPLQISQFPLVAALILTLFLSKSLLSLLLARKSTLLVAAIEARVARRVAEKLFSDDLSAVRTKSREEITFAIQVGSPAAFNTLLNSVSTIAAEGALFLAICFGFLWVSPAATVAALFYFGAVGAAIHLLVGRRVSLYGGTSARSSVGANEEINNLYSVFRELFVVGRTDDFLARLGDARLEAANSEAARIYLRGIPRYVIEASLLIGLTVLAGFQLAGGNFLDSAATLGVFLAGGFRLTGALIPLQASFLDIKYALPQAEKAMIILSLEGERKISQKVTTDLINRIDEPIEILLDKVSYQYPEGNKPALKELSLHIKPGEQVAFVGPSGAGKSTLADLLAGLISSDSGEIKYLVDGKNIEIMQLAGRVGYVPQKPGMLAGNILNNISLCFDESIIDQEFAKSCLEQVGLLDLVESLPKGLKADIGHLRDSLSGGQLQRLGLARALYFKPTLLILDEATSALDAQAESNLITIIGKLRGRITTVLIAHRLNSVKDCDRVFFVDGGSLVDSGSLKEISRRNPEVAKMIELLTVH
jgi:ATP-binding cassette subfamily C protein